jgi:hypothetical protein
VLGTLLLDDVMAVLDATVRTQVHLGLRSAEDRPGNPG